MRRVVGLFVASFWMTAAPLWAGPLTVNYCPGDSTCPTGIYEASLTFTDILNGDGDPNDYYLDIWIKGTLAAPAYVDELSFSISGVQTPGGYETQPDLLAAPNEGAPWIVFWDNISASVKSCTKDTANSQEVCTQSEPGDKTNFGAPVAGQALHWQYVVDLTGSFQLSTSTNVNLRAQFLNSTGGNAGILSPDGGRLTQVPEPSSLLLCAFGVLAAGGRFRRRRTPGGRPS